MSHALGLPVVCLLMISYLKIEILSMFRAGIKIHVHLVDSWATSEISHTTFIWLVHLFTTALWTDHCPTMTMTMKWKLLLMFLKNIVILLLLFVLHTFLSTSHAMVYKNLFTSWSYLFCKTLNSFRDRPSLWVVSSVFISVCMVNSSRLETEPRLWVVHALTYEIVLSARLADSDLWTVKGWNHRIFSLFLAGYFHMPVLFTPYLFFWLIEIELGDFSEWFVY